MQTESAPLYTAKARLRGIAHISAVTIAAELGQVSRFAGTRELMGYCGAVPSENSSGKRTRRGVITKTGNAHLRRIIIEAAWNYHRPPAIWVGMKRELLYRLSPGIHVRMSAPVIMMVLVSLLLKRNASGNLR